MSEYPPISQERQHLLSLIAKKVTNPLVLQAFGKVDRAKFVPTDKGEAYKDKAIKLSDGSSISQPTVVAIMINALSLTGREITAEIGTASGYASAILAEMSSSVKTFEYNLDLARNANDRLSDLGYDRVTVYSGDGLQKIFLEGPFDAILVSGACRQIPQSLVNELAIGGRMVLPVGKDPFSQELVLVRKGKNSVSVKQLVGARFVPIISSAHGGWTPESYAAASNRKKEAFLNLEELSPNAARALKGRIIRMLNSSYSDFEWTDVPVPNKFFADGIDPLTVLLEYYPFLKSFFPQELPPEDYFLIEDPTLL